MAIVRRANVVYSDIKDEDIEYFMNNGFNLINERGEIIKEAMPRDLGTLQKCYTEHTAKIAELESEIAELKSELAKAKKVKKADTK